MNTQSIRNICVTVLVIALCLMDLLAHKWGMPKHETDGWDMIAGLSLLVWCFAVL